MKASRNFVLMLTLTVSVEAGADPETDQGRKVFKELAQPGCGMCHTLADAGSTGQIGPDLDQLAPSQQQVIAAVKNGVGVMPSFADSLTSEQITAVAHYVEKAASQ